ncbi:MAG: helix-turn-helix transcriptional regulator [Proteobacteria bacterium]|nr:helix-turn-helix transcriptional regulator [Pseudomonadota bacterium]
MEELGVNRKTLAEKLNVSKAYVTKLLRGNINFTLKTIISVANVLESDIQFDFIPKGQKRRVLHYHDNSGSEATAKSKTTARNISAQKGKIYSVKYNNSDEEAIPALTQGGADDYANAA